MILFLTISKKLLNVCVLAKLWEASPDFDDRFVGDLIDAEVRLRLSGQRRIAVVGNHLTVIKSMSMVINNILPFASVYVILFVRTWVNQYIHSSIPHPSLSFVALSSLSKLQDLKLLYICNEG